MRPFAVSVLLFGLLAAGLIWIDAVEWLHEITRTHEGWEFDEILLALFLLALWALFILWRRARRLERSVRSARDEVFLRGQSLDAVSTGVVFADAHDPELPVVYANPAFCKIAGYAPTEIIGRSMAFLQRDDNDQTGLHELRAALAEKRPCRVLLRNYRKDGTLFWNDLRVSPIRDEAGELIHFMGIVNDVTERVGADRRLQESESKFRDFAEASADRFWETDAEYRYSWIHDPTGGFTNLIPVEQLIGKTRWEAAGETNPDRDPLWRAHRADHEARRPFRDFEHKIVIPGKPVAWRRVSGVPVFDADGGFVGYRGTATDLTDQKFVEERLHRTQRMEAMGQLTGGVAHDFNNLLGSMILNTELLIRKNGDGDNVKRHAAAIRAAIMRGSALTDRLLAFSRQQTLSPVPSSVSDLIGGLEDMFRRTLGEMVELKVESAPDLWPALIDPHQFENALVNLAINARDAMPDGGVLNIKTANITLDDVHGDHYEEIDPGDYVRISVQDSGAGMPTEVRRRAFEPFFTTKDAGEGSGLGLSMVYGFVKQSNGNITIDSLEGLGTTVELYLPRSTEAVQKSWPSTNPSALAQGSERILIVEDDADLREVSGELLRAQGYDVVEAETGRAALAELKKKQPVNLVFTDIVLVGGMDGAQFAEEAMRLNPSVKVLYTSGYPDNILKRNEKLAADVTLLKKPYGGEELLELVRATLDGEC